VELSVVIAARDAAATLGEQLDALAAQEWDGPWEVLVVDNGSTDATCALVRQAAERWPTLRLVEATGGIGPAYARNAGARLAAGRSLVFCDADDVVAPGWIAAVGGALRDEEFVCGPVDIVTLNPPWLAASRGTTGTTDAAVFEDRFPFASSCNLGIRRVRFLDAGGFDEDLLAGEDVDLSMRMFCAGVALAYVPAAVVHYRFRPTLRSTYDQAVAYGRVRPLIAERWRVRRGGEDVARFRGVRNYAWLVRHAPLLGSQAGRARWLWVAGQLVGTVEGSRRVRRLYL
jgi:glycosyltransferase involved in cell wall biosynthesis